MMTKALQILKTGQLQSPECVASVIQIWVRFVSQIDIDKLETKQNASILTRIK